MTYPIISHIDEVLPSVMERDEFVIADKDDYTVIDYVYTLEDTFDDPIRKECRGIKFAPDGSVLARPLHKFKNIGESPEVAPAALDFTQPHTITEKLDGSMIHSAMIDGEVVFMTRMGRTDHALTAERHLTPAVRDYCAGLHRVGQTCIFEWTAPDNRIVINYEESQLSLLAVRSNRYGTYANQAGMVYAAAHMQIPHARGFNRHHTSATDFLAYVRDLKGLEGFVVRFADGTWVKAKAEDYVLKHRAKDSVTQEKNILRLVLNGELDDVLPVLDPRTADSARRYRDEVLRGVDGTARGLRTIVNIHAGMSQKEFATEIAAGAADYFKPLLFQVRAGRDPHEAVRSLIEQKATSQTGVDSVRGLICSSWAA
ncbi:RNA ligase [Labrenzia sp. THAF35]|uniref:RNA ligase n=1 Tax=Labrenzia sp. THAF35 TaxID=2587854 RepID=UPI0012A87FDD|nr:RNA ligase [Labrenzia sp. THAF35]QFT69653.1 RNA ligase [Labrenzia sp. THAF35]